MAGPAAELGRSAASAPRTLMSDKTEMRAPEKPDDANAVIALTRKRWDWYFLAATAVAAVLGFAFWFVLEDLSPLMWPLSVVALWLFLRFQTPVGGMPARRISATPGARQLLAWLALMGVLFAGVFAFDGLVLGQGWHEPLKSYHLGLYLPLLIVLLVGVWTIEKRYPRIRD
jgi:hypothetical protein